MVLQTKRAIVMTSFKATEPEWWPDNTFYWDDWYEKWTNVWNATSSIDTGNCNCFFTPVVDYLLHWHLDRTRPKASHRSSVCLGCDTVIDIFWSETAHNQRVISVLERGAFERSVFKRDAVERSVFERGAFERNAVERAVPEYAWKNRILPIEMLPFQRYSNWW